MGHFIANVLAKEVSWISFHADCADYAESRNHLERTSKKLIYW